MMSTTKDAAVMICEGCRVACQRFGKHRNGLRRFRCPQCKRTYTEPRQRVLDGTYIPDHRIVLALRLLLEGNSMSITPFHPARCPC